MEKSKTRVMMATKAIHQLGDISRDDYCYCVITGEDEKNYIGNWVTGMGFMNVKFPKETTREMTEQEKKWLDDNERRFRIGPLDEALAQKDPIR